MITRYVQLDPSLLSSLQYWIEHFPESQTMAYVLRNGFPKSYSRAYTMALRIDQFICQQIHDLIVYTMDCAAWYYALGKSPAGQTVTVIDPSRPLLNKLIELQGDFINDMSIGTQAYVA